MKLQYIPNILTGLRFLLVIPILLSLLNQHYTVALYLFILAGLTDGLDGLLARLYNWTSRFGAIADPLADKILLMSSFLALSWLGQIPIWLVGLVITRDIWIMCGVLSYRYVIGSPDFLPTVLSKINTFLQLLLITLLLLHLSMNNIPSLLLTSIMWAVAVCSGGSFLHYTWVWGRRALRMMDAQKIKTE